MIEKLFDKFFEVGQIIEGPKLTTSYGSMIGRVELIATKKNIFVYERTFVCIFNKKDLGITEIYKSLKLFFNVTLLSEEELYLYLEKIYHTKIKQIKI